ncbi:hypothetical protein B484DRAFT_406942 [Ochromonadaceae sp. CCMP2298]|nr:hypothetical protein B484DRAFT_406942 [Ochromonadaceae sp. CCMP2298]
MKVQAMQFECSWYSFAEAYRRPVREGSAAAVLCVAESRREFGGWLPSVGTVQHLLQVSRPSAPCNQSLQGSAPGLPAPPWSSAEALSATALSTTVRGARLRRSRLCAAEAQARSTTWSVLAGSAAGAGLRQIINLNAAGVDERVGGPSGQGVVTA